MARPEPAALVCPSCGTAHPLHERFCAACGMPLVHPGPRGADAVVTEAHARARKIKPQLSEGELVRVAGGRHQAEAELIQGMLLEEGVPSMLRRSRGFDVPDMLAAGPRDVLVPRSGVQTAREVLLQADLLPAPDGRSARARAGIDAPSRILLGLVAALVVVALIAWIGTELLV
ncbi:zinc ribbon domain-containing protein [Baekduia soli]|uniref:Zinc ribbon domain-containing protein n=1 Tax=Baekduia soli TaxID=496014 RepID=A0A5B8UA94_9ACTN|nr:zinc ribbon domain-containing protein [Baekduia soli]QEC49955.1 zinc ribbon domain-containing protein [Baekduia soli]